MLIKNRVKGIKGENFPFFRQTTPRPPYGARPLPPLKIFGICIIMPLGVKTRHLADFAPHGIETNAQDMPHAAR